MSIYNTTILIDFKQLKIVIYSPNCPRHLGDGHVAILLGGGFEHRPQATRHQEVAQVIGLDPSSAGPCHLPGAGLMGDHQQQVVRAY